ncbi:MAG: presqualene diphosphate synthase HpnD [Zoogloeaceae bacterium]|jgi:phytoene synthase|nr:presqualene diphosphate synthase HpnD [Zoogloeaceae bacterium]
MTPDAYCQRKTAASGSSFYWSFRFLPPVKRQAITALYAFCREVDDIVDDGSLEPEMAALRLAWWRQEIARLDGSEAPQHPVGLALREARKRFDLPVEQLQEIIDGMTMDLERPRYADFTQLSLYCYRVASVVGLLAAEIFGMQAAHETRRYAHDLGLAFQLTNIIRDVGEDARRGRIYLPIDELQRFGVPAADILHSRYSDNFTALMQFQYERAVGYYVKALGELPACDAKAQRPGLRMAAVYRALLEELKESRFEVLHQRISLGGFYKLRLAFSGWKKLPAAA